MTLSEYEINRVDIELSMKSIGLILLECIWGWSLTLGEYEINKVDIELSMKSIRLILLECI